MGVPHVYGATDELAFYGAGYQMATDRLYQMESLRRFSLGRLSEVIGEEGLERDLQARTFDFPRWGRLDYELMQAVDPERVRLVSAWLRGINRRISEVRSGLVPLPFGYGPGQMDFLPEPWDEADPYIILKGANFALDKTVEFEVAVSVLSLLYADAMAVVGLPVGGPYLMNWTGFKARPARWFMELNRADSLDAFEEAVDRMREMTYNFLGADATGIAYRVGVEVPLRRDTGWKRAPWKAMLSWDPESLWSGETLSPLQLPRSRARERGWLATANNDPFGFTGDGRVDNDPWYYGSLFDPGYRAQRITDELERLTRRGDLSREDFQGLQTDIKSTLAADLLPLLAAAHARIPSDEELARFRDRPGLDALVRILALEWDGRMARDPAGGDTVKANEDYVEGRYRKLRFHREEIEAALRERIVLAPE